MREIKFRCWMQDGEWDDEKDQQKFVMVDGDSLAFESYEPLVDLLQDIEGQQYFMQFTGLKDKNSTEIYEGDVLRKEGHHDREVMWKDDAFVVKYIGYSSEQLPRLSHYVHNSEVIGNIWENPELLDETSRPSTKRAGFATSEANSSV